MMARLLAFALLTATNTNARAQDAFQCQRYTRLVVLNPRTRICKQELVHWS